MLLNAQVILADAGKKIEADLLGIADSLTQEVTQLKVSSYNEESDDETMEVVERKHIKKFWNPVRVTEPMQLKSLV